MKSSYFQQYQYIILWQIFDVIQSDVMLQKQVQQNFQ